MIRPPSASLIIFLFFLIGSNPCVRADDGDAPSPSVIEKEAYDSISKDFLSLPALTAEKISEANEDAFEKMQSPPTRLHPRLKNSITLAEAKEIYQQLESHPVASLSNLGRYDPQEEYGFCFGRAFTVELEANHQKIQNPSIRKIWVVGDMQAPDGSRWGWHVATMIYGGEKTWWVIDPEIYLTNPKLKIVTPETWFAEMKTLSKDGKLRVLWSDGRKFGATMGMVDPFSISSKFYNGYFDDLLRIFRQRAQGGCVKTLILSQIALPGK